jgi:3D (Asp-Asp-Asp) domain-containing protein
MTLNKPKNILYRVNSTIDVALIAAFLAYFVAAPLANAEMAKVSIKQGKTVVTISESPAGRLFNPPTTDNTPSQVVRAVITAYTSTPGQTDSTPFIAAKGKYVYDGMIAANWLPIGTKVKIPSLYGDKIFTVDDRMNARYGFGRMDIWLDNTRNLARKFGVKRVPVEIFYQG